MKLMTVKYRKIKIDLIQRKYVSNMQRYMEVTNDRRKKTKFKQINIYYI